MYVLEVVLKDFLYIIYAFEILNLTNNILGVWGEESAYINI